MTQQTHLDGQTIYWYDQYCEAHYPNGFKDYTVEAVMRDLDAVDADVYAIYATNQWGIAYYPSDILPTYPPLGGRDYFGEVVAALKQRGKRVIAYTNWLDSRHPEWRWQRLAPGGKVVAGQQPDMSKETLQPVPMYDTQGKGTVYELKFGEWFTHCLNSPRREEMVRVAEEIVSRYPVDAFHLDMAFNSGVCVCPHCRPHLAELLGSDDITYAGIMQHWGDYLAWRHERSTALAAELSAVAHSHGLAFAPNAFCPLYTGPLMAVNPGWWEHVDAYVTEAWLRLAQDHADLDSTTLVCKWLRALGIPGVLLITGQHMPFWHAPIAPQEMRLHAAVAKGNGRPILGPCGVGAYPSAATNQEGLRTMRQANEFYTADAPTDSTREPARHIGVVWSEDSRNFYEPGEGASGYRYEFLGICRALTESHRVFNLLLPDRLHSAQDLAGYELIIMPNTACMDEPLANLIREYVRGGGRLLCTWETSLCDRRGGQRDDFLLADVLGLRYSGKYPTPAFYVEREDEPTVALGQATIVTPTTAETLARLVAPDPDYPDSLDDLIPGPLTEHPMLTVNRFGQGVAWYVAGPIACSAYRTGYYQTRQLIEEIIGRTGLSAWMTVSAPPTVEVSVERDAGGRLYVHLANKTAPAYLPGRAITRSIDTLIPVADVRLTFEGYGTARCVSPVDGKVTVTHSTDRVECTIPRLDDYLLLEVTL